MSRILTTLSRQTSHLVAQNTRKISYEMKSNYYNYFTFYTAMTIFTVSTGVGIGAYVKQNRFKNSPEYKAWIKNKIRQAKYDAL